MSDFSLNDIDHKMITEIINWFAQHSFDKYHAGALNHGGTLPRKGGLLHEAEMECLDHVIYIRALRHQLAGIYDGLKRGAVSDSTEALRLVLYGHPTDKLPVGII